MIKNLLLIGGGGHCKAVIDSLASNNQYAEIDIVDRPENVRNLVLGKKVIGEDSELEELYRRGYHYAFVTVGSIGDVTVRVRLHQRLEQLGYSIPNIIDPTAVISTSVMLGKGIYVGKNAVVNAGTQINNGAIINTAATIEHDCRIGEFVHVSSGAILCGNVMVGDYTHIGAGSMIRQQVRIGKSTMIGMGSVVLKDIGDSLEAYGNPCREVFSNTKGGSLE